MGFIELRISPVSLFVDLVVFDRNSLTVVGVVSTILISLIVSV